MARKKEIQYLTTGKKVILTKDWKNPDGITFPAGSLLIPNRKILKELTEGGYLDKPEVSQKNTK